MVIHKYFPILLVLFSFILVGCTSQEEQPDQILSRDDVISFVEKAVEYANTYGKERALKEFMNTDGEFILGELYMFADSFEGIVLAHGGNPELVGQDIMEITGKRGKKIMPEMIILAKQGKGWMEYYWTNPVSKKDERKLTYVMKVDETWFVGAGMYEKDIK